VVVEKGGQIVGLLTLLFLLTISSVAAHAELRESYPEPGAHFRWERPQEVRLTFTQQLEAATIVVMNRQFEQVQVGETRVEPLDPRNAVVALGELAPGTYTVNWHTESEDGHAQDGAYDFTVFPRASLITGVVAALVLPLFGLMIYLRRARPGDEE
jgi:methionine-rich copper-binding protein CopC